MCTTIKIDKALINDRSLSNTAKLILLYMIANCDQAGVYTIDYRKFRKDLGFKFHGKSIGYKLRGYVEILDKDRVLIIPYLRWTWGKRLDHWSSEKAYYLTKTRMVVKINRLKYKKEDHRLICFKSCSNIDNYQIIRTT